MTDDPKQTVNSELVRAAHLVEGISQSISTDGTVAMLTFKIRDGSTFAITVDVGHLNMVQSMVAYTIRQAQARKISPGNVVIKQPLNFQIGYSEQYRNHVLIEFDPGANGEPAYLLRDDDALRFTSEIERNIYSRKSMSDRRDALAHAPKLILPGLPGGEKPQ